MRLAWSIGAAMLGLVGCSDSSSGDDGTDGTGGMARGAAGSGGSGGSDGSGGSSTGGSSAGGSAGSGGVSTGGSAGSGGSSAGGSAGSGGLAGSSSGGMAGTAGAGGMTSGAPVDCSFPASFEPGFNVYACDITDAADCRLYHPRMVTDPLCGDNDTDWVINFMRSSSPDNNSVRVRAPWTITAMSHGFITSERLVNLPDDTSLSFTIDDGMGTEFEAVFEVIRANGSISVTSINML